MKILAIETSCDETAIALIDASGNPKKKGGYFDVLSNVVLSQVKLHAKYGGVFPSLAKREHSKNLIPLLKQVLKESGFLRSKAKSQKSKVQFKILNSLLEREPELLNQFLKFIPHIEKPPIDAIAVTYGPGLEPALWVGINFAKALSLVWNIPIIPVNHMEGHVFSALLKKRDKFHDSCFMLHEIKFPMLALLISGGHTELVLIKRWLDYKIVGETKDDAAGEAFDKVARMLGLPYPGGPAISAHAQKWHGVRNKELGIKLPRPMIDSKDFNFSFSGLKTAVLYRLKDIKKITPAIVQEFCYEFENAVTDVLVSKTIKAAEKYKVKTILVGGGVSANKRIRNALIAESGIRNKKLEILLSPLELTGDNALMIGVVGSIRARLNKKFLKPAQGANSIQAIGTLRLQ